MLPTSQEDKKIEELINKTSEILRKWNVNHKNYQIENILPQGSTGLKQTHLQDAADLDLFIMLNPDNYRDIIYKNNTNQINYKQLRSFFKTLCKEWIIPALKESGYKKILLSYAEHPYVSAVHQDFDIDIVFAFLIKKKNLIKNGPITAVDRTYHHTKFITSNLTKEQRNDVRLLKKFFKTHLSYGDKAATGRGGFIGYSAELMIYYLEDIWTVFEKFESLPNCPLDFYKRTEKELRNRQRFQNNLLLIMDPTDENRNVAASISPRSWIYCNDLIQNFRKNPSSDYFLKNQLLDYQKLLNNIDKQQYVVVEYEERYKTHYTKVRDKLYSMANSLKRKAAYDNNHNKRFGNVSYAIYFNPSTSIYSLSFFTKKPIIDKYYLRRGPPADNSDHQKNFAKANPDYFKKDGFCWAKEERKQNNFYEFIKQNEKEQQIKEVKRLRIGHPSQNLKTDEGKISVVVLKDCILPYEEELKNILRKKNISITF
ncbi:MAG: hypothetical protein GF364_05785 [Candidatus Lokiarchaeota archaeon]|nr:hypothetical protein [Candidatus Lokiarchaeota archaeon]